MESKRSSKKKNEKGEFISQGSNRTLRLPGSDPSAVEAIVDPQRIALAFNVLKSVPACQNSGGIIKHYLFADGIEITHSGKRLLTDNEFQKHVNKYFQDYGEEALDWIWCVGVVPMTITYDEDANEYIPTVIKHGAGYIRSVYKNHKQKFYYQSFNADYEDSQVVVLSNFGYNPTIDGRLTSIINCLIPMETTTGLFLDCAGIAETVRCNPAYAIQMRKDTTKPSNRVGIDYGFYAEYDTSDERTTSHIWRRDAQALERLKMQNEEINKMYYKTPYNVKVDENGRLEPQKPWTGNEYHVPDNMELVHQTLPQVRNDLIDVMKFNNSEIYGALGVPESMATGNVGSKSGNADAINDMFKITILSWKRKIASLLTMAYNILYGHEDAKFIIDEFFYATRIRISQVTEGLLHSIQKNNKIEIRLPIPPFITTHELLTLYQQGALTPEEYCNYLRNKANLPPVNTPPFIAPRAGEQKKSKGDQEETPAKKQKIA